ncbi:uncharacterized protein LOC108911725 [Anoplophora glabripennis]|uniref:uncharacterized protein LOC108911725 n=1 Tax=Anoplophora glabripennis TaxID=217634 RepID=UPI0008748163|nr:uncharacterized protein LOC108911725 [Anoplophora glabripennis]XP_018572240.1 uncharacterized protein LOC108911725 [Anoplophora glabripennis]
MAAVVSHAMRRFPTSPTDAVYTSYGLRGEGSHKEGESSLSRSMRYADPWLYGSVRAPGGLLLAPAFVLCTCQDYVNGTKRSSKKSPSTCKKCKGTRLPLPPVDSTKFGTVRCYPTSVHAVSSTPLRAGTVRVSSSSRPSILPSADPYDLMRRSRLSVAEGAGHFRARSISPGKSRNGDARSHSGTRSKGAKPDSYNASCGRRSILECDINPYELISSSKDTASKESSITFVSGQRIRIRPSLTNQADYEDVQVNSPPSLKAPPTSKLPANQNKTATNSPNKPGKVRSPVSSPKPNEKESEFSSRFKSILKKPSSTFSDSDSAGPERSPTPSLKGGSQFYIPMPCPTPRKKVQFLVGNELVRNQLVGNRKGETVRCRHGDDNGVEEDKKITSEERREEQKTDQDKPEETKTCSLKRSYSDRVPNNQKKVVFHDTMALRQRMKRVDSRAPFDEKDLERLDGITPRTRKISLTKSRPSAPPPPPPPMSPVGDEEEKYYSLPAEINVREENVKGPSETHTEVQKLDKLESNGRPELATSKTNVDVKSKKCTRLTLTEVLGVDEQINEQPSPQIANVEVKNMQYVIGFSQKCIPIEPDPQKADPDDKSVQLKEKISLEKLDHCLNNYKPQNDVSPSPTPPSAPPRKRSNNKQPQVAIIKTPSPSMHRVRIESPPVECANRTVVQINGTPAVHKLQIKNEFSDVTNVHTVSIVESPQRKTSILINGDDCYSTVNVNDDVPLYQSSVVVKDTAAEASPKPLGKRSSTVYITGTFISKDTNGFDGVTKDYKAPSELEGNVEEKRPPSSDLLKEILKDPVEAVRRNLVPHVCGKSDVPRRPRDTKTFNSRAPSLMGESLLESPLEDKTSAADSIEDSFLRLRNYDAVAEDISSEHSSSTQYELMDPGSDCYTDHSNRSSVTEEELSNRTKFYELLAESATVEVSENDDHHYETIKVSNDPIYEEIEIPPPLPANPPPSSLLDDLNLDKEFTTRSIFEGASKYDILSYLVDAKERGIVQEDNYSYNFGNNTQTTEEETKEAYNRVSQMSTVSDSSEDNSLIISGALIDEKATFQKAAEVERNDSGVGSETSKSSLSKYRTKQEVAVLCEDCDVTLEAKIENEPLICRKCVKKRTERKEIIMEIVETEEKYSRDLQIILEEFYQPMLVAGLLTADQLSAIFLNVEELLENSQALAERLRDAVEIALEQGDDDLLTVNIGKLFLEAAPMLHGFETYCIRQGAASLLLASLEKDKELLRIFLRVSQMENTMLRRMNLNSFLMVPVQRVTKYPLLLARLFKVTPAHHDTRDQLKEAQHKIELHLNHMNSETKDVPSKLWRRIGSSSGRRSSAEMDLVNIKLRKIAVDVLEWNHEEAKFVLEGKLLFTQPSDNNWRKGRTIKLAPINALLVINGKASVGKGERTEENGIIFARHGAREAALLLVRDKNGRYSLLREPLYLDRCVIAADPAWQSYFEVQELLGKDTFIFKAEDEEQTQTWYKQLQFFAQGMGAWRKRRNALANIMINGMGLRS